MTRFLYIALVATCLQFVHHSWSVSVSSQELKSSERPAGTVIQVLSSNQDTEPGSYLDAHLATENFDEAKDFSQDLLQRKEKETFALNVQNGDSDSSNAENRKVKENIDEPTIRLKARNWLDNWEQNLDSYSKIMDDSFSDHPFPMLPDDGALMRTTRGRTGRMPLAFGKRAHSSSLQDTTIPDQLSGELGKSKAVKTSHRNEWPNDELEIVLISQLLNNRDIKAPWSHKGVERGWSSRPYINLEESGSNDVDPEHLSRNTRGRLQRMPYAFGKRFTKLSDPQNLKNMDNKENLKNLANIPPMFTSRPRKKSLPKPLADGLIGEIDKQSIEYLARALNGPTLQQISPCKNGQEDECLISKESRLEAVLDGDGRLAIKPSFNREQRSRMPLTFGKREKAYAALLSEEMKKRGALRRMPLAFGKRRRADAPTDSSGLDIWDLPVQVGQPNLSDKRGSLRRMPLSFGKRNRGERSVYQTKENDHEPSYQQRVSMEDHA